jgi:carboxylesterase type B
LNLVLGAFSFGSGDGYEPKYLMENEDVIVITLNYRLGVFGFLSTGDEQVLHDIQESLLVENN